MTKKEAEAMAVAVVDLVKQVTDPLKARIEQLEAAHTTLAEKALKGGTVWQRGQAYAVNDCVQHDGSLWKCVETHVAGATFSHECFLLHVKHGRDGRDAR